MTENENQIVHLLTRKTMVALNDCVKTLKKYCDVLSIWTIANSAAIILLFYLVLK